METFRCAMRTDLFGKMAFTIHFSKQRVPAAAWSAAGNTCKPLRNQAKR